jgi:pseudouridine-5'-phosphate glycosidase
VHRGAELTFDISADLRELALSPVIVVAAGAKAILDIPKTMEVLETYGVPVIAYGQDVMPAFWSQKSDIPAPLRCDTPQQIAAGFRTRQALGLSGDEICAEEIGPMIELALHEAQRQRISAKAVTPFLLNRIFELTEGKSLQTNIALVKNNARLAAQIAKSCWELPKS